MTAALLDRPSINGSCALPWCMSAWDHDRDSSGGNSDLLHYGRPSFVESYDGDSVNVVPYQFSGSEETTGVRVEVGAGNEGRHQIPLTPDRAFDFAVAIFKSATDDLIQNAIFKDEHGRMATVFAGKRLVHHGRYDYWLVKLSFFDADDGDQPVEVELRDLDAAHYARFVEAAAVEVTR